MPLWLVPAASLLRWILAREGHKRREAGIAKSTFVKDLAQGKEAEVKVQKYLNSSGECYYAQAQGKVKEYDLYCIFHGELAEIKNDRMARITGNICFEKALFASTKSKTIVYVIGDTAYIYDKNSLWNALTSLAKEGKTTFKMLGDRNANPAILVKTEDILPLAKQANLKEG